VFERFNPAARGTLFAAWNAVRERGGMHIEPEHVVLGILRADGSAIRQFTAIVGAFEALEQRLESAIPAGPKFPEVHEIPFSSATVAAIEGAVVEADDLENSHIRSEHLLLGVLVKTSGEAAGALHAAGVGVAAIRQFLGSVSDDPHSGGGR
jgi:ATP-dependent Clp protease ATP-binding subunit ClpA